MLIHCFLSFQEFIFDSLPTLRGLHLFLLYIVWWGSVSLVKTYNFFFKFWVIMDMRLENLIGVFFESKSQILLWFHFFLKFYLFIWKASWTHFQISNNQDQVGVHSLEKLHFLFHLGGLLQQLLNNWFSGFNFTFEFLNFVIKHKFELF